MVTIEIPLEDALNLYDELEELGLCGEDFPVLTEIDEELEEKLDDVL